MVGDRPRTVSHRRRQWQLDPAAVTSPERHQVVHQLHLVQIEQSIAHRGHGHADAGAGGRQRTDVEGHTHHCEAIAPAARLVVTFL